MGDGDPRAHVCAHIADRYQETAFALVIRSQLCGVLGRNPGTGLQHRDPSPRASLLRAPGRAQCRDRLSDLAGSQELCDAPDPV